MTGLYTCTTCKTPKLANTENYYRNQIARAAKNTNLTTIGKCITCAKEYQSEYTTKLKEKKLSRARNPIVPKMGTLYIIAPINNIHHPYKIGISIGRDISRRLTALQTSHWLDLKVYYKSEPMPDVGKIERMLHNKYKHKRVRGEWFNIDQRDIEDIVSECNKVSGSGSNRPEPETLKTVYL